MYTFKEHLGNCPGVVIMDLEAEGQTGKLRFGLSLRREAKKEKQAEE